MAVGQKIAVGGFVTKQKSLAGRSLLELESILGFHAGRLANGATFAALDRLPLPNEFETRGYSQVADHRHATPPGLDMAAIKRMAMAAWAPSGPDRLIKVMAVTLHNTGMRDDDQYPPGQGVPQWKLVMPIPATVIAVLGRYGDVFRP
jgi:hypothetical protein